MSNSSNDIDDSSSHYFEVCSNSIELNQQEIQNNNFKIAKEDSKSDKSSFLKDNSNINYDSPPKKSVNNTTNSTDLFSSYKFSNFNSIVKTNNNKSTNKVSEKTFQKHTDKDKFNIFTMNSVKKKLLSPIDENAKHFFKNADYEKLNDKLNDNTNSINDYSNNGTIDLNKNININIIINKKNKKINKNKFIQNNTNISNININPEKNNNQYKIEVLDTDANNKKSEKSNTSIYSSLDEISSTTIRKKSTKKIKNHENESDLLKATVKDNINQTSSIIERISDKKSDYKNTLSESTINGKDNYRKIDVDKENSIVFRDSMSFLINYINFEEISQDSLTVNELKSKFNLREIPVKRKDIPEKDRYIKTLIELQIFNFGDKPIWALKMSKNGKYLAAGNKLGKIRIYETMGYDYDKYQKEYNKKTIVNFLHFVEEKAIKELSEHKSDITDLSWSPYLEDLLLSASVDHFVILWDISREDNCCIEKYEHNDLVTCVQFSPTIENIFVTGCFDKYVRLYNISNYINEKKGNNVENDFNQIEETKNKNKNKNKKIKENISSYSSKKIKDFFNLTDKITAISFFPNGDQLAIGTINGKINIYDILSQQIRYNHSFNCRNRVGKNSLGKKITNITFINKINALITTCDSCIRLIEMNDGKNITKYRGYENEKSMIRATPDLSNDVIISGSENGFSYLWNIVNKKDKKRKNYNYEYFQPFLRDIVECSIIIDEKCFVNYIKKVLKITNRINIISVIINSTDKGKIEVLLNINEDF